LGRGRLTAIYDESSQATAALTTGVGVGLGFERTLLTLFVAILDNLSVNSLLQLRVVVDDEPFASRSKGLIFGENESEFCSIPLSIDVVFGNLIFKLIAGELNS